ncbi:GNAT family N-acetyltransferase [Candidatus Woesearchaeota archaeon]|nr:GNAT family N-acetyltransferase [Candidatus Woesearchaeota archaeon]
MKVTLRRTRLSDAKRVQEMLAHPKVAHELGTHDYSLEQAKKDCSQKKKGKFKEYAFTVLADGNIAGQIFIENPTRCGRTYEIGYYVAYEYWGRGIATKAVQQAMTFAFTTLRLHKLHGNNDSDNPASGKVMENAGFVKEGVQRSHVLKGRKYIDIIHWGYLRR